MEPKIHYGTPSDLTSGCISLSNGSSGLTLNGSSGLTLTAPSSYGTTITYSNQINNNMNQQQVKVAVFKVARNKDNTIKSSTFINEFWIEKKPGVSIDFAVAKLLKGEYEADEIIIKEIYTVTL
jgi:hypothetical protein